MPQRNNNNKAPMHSEQSFCLSLNEVCYSFGVEKTWVEAVVEEGIITPVSEDEASFDAKAIRRLRISIRLQQDLDINISGIALVLDLLEEIEELKQQLHEES